MYTVPQLTDFSPAALDNAARDLLSALESESASVNNENEWKLFRDRWLARKDGIATQINDLWLKAAPKEAKRDVGQRVNELKQKIEATVETTLQRAQGGASSAKLAADRVDITLPGIRRPLGAEHPVIRTMNEIVSVFRNLGYSVSEGPEIETDYYNFESLNFPPNHPARDMQDTLFLAGQEAKPLRDRLLLRTHTSPVQIRTMETAEASPAHRDPGQGVSQRSARTRATRRCFTRSRASRSTPTSRSAISRARSITP